MQLFAQRNTTRVCHSCQAPNPERLLNCYACGSDLAEAPRTLPTKGELTFACTECKKSVSFRMDACPHCGKSIAPVERIWQESVREAVLPRGWKSKPLANNTVLVTRSGWNRWRVPHIHFLLIPGAISVTLATLLVVPNAFAASVHEATPFLWGICGFFALLGTLGIVLPLLLAETIQVGFNVLEVRRAFWLYRFHRRIEGGCLQVKTVRRGPSNGRPGEVYWARLLQADDYGEPLVLQEVPAKMFWEDEEALVYATNNEVSQLGLFLAEITRWRLDDEGAQRYGD